MERETSFGLKGYALPLTPEGRSSVVDGPPPWYYGGEVLHLSFRADAEKVRRFLPEPLEVGPDPGEGILWLTEWVSVSASRPNLAFVNPERAVYRECIVLLGCSLNGERGYFVPHIWVDNDFTLMRGFIQGFPKKLGRIYLTKLHELNPLVGGRRVGARVKGICEAYGERIVEGALTFTRRAEPSELPPLKFFLMRHFPDLEDPERPAVHELVASVVPEVRFGEMWAGEAEGRIFASEVDEAGELGPIEMRGGFYYSMGLTIAGGKVLHRYRRG